MPKFIKKPIEIEALRWTGEDHRAMYDFLENTSPYGAIEPYGDNFYIDHTKVVGGLIIKTAEGEHIASIGDWIIKGIQGEYYPCKPDIFEATYERVEDSGHVWSIHIPTMCGSAFATTYTGENHEIPEVETFATKALAQADIDDTRVGCPHFDGEPMLVRVKQDVVEEICEDTGEIVRAHYWTPE